MKEMFKQHLYDYLYYIITKDHLEMEWSCEKDLNQLIETSVDKISFQDSGKEEMQCAKANLETLFTNMNLDARSRGLQHLDSISILNALSQSNGLWPFGDVEVNATERIRKESSPDYNFA
jgi:hypothetical protein